MASSGGAGMALPRWSVRAEHISDFTFDMSFATRNDPTFLTLAPLSPVDHGGPACGIAALRVERISSAEQDHGQGYSVSDGRVRALEDPPARVSIRQHQHYSCNRHSP
jgi:hypothetical protein